MESNTIVTPIASLNRSFLPSPVVCRRQHANNRRLLLFPLAVNSRGGSVRKNHKRNLSFCTKTALTGNLETTGFPISVPVRVAHELLQAGHRFLDVSAGHAVGAINIPFMYRVGSGMTKNPRFLDEVSSSFREHDEIIVGCQSGKRSVMAAAVLLADGFTVVTDIAGGCATCTLNGLPTEH